MVCIWIGVLGSRLVHYIELLLHGIHAHRFALDQLGVIRIEELAI